MTFTRCPHCNRTTFAYHESCDRCEKPLGDGLRPLYGFGGGPIESFICRNCAYVNDPEDELCRDCGTELRKGDTFELE